MKLLQNREIRIRIRLFVLLTAAGILFGLLFVNGKGAVLAGSVGMLAMALYLLDMKSRYESMKRLTGQIDEILHGNDETCLSDYQEGELSLLKSEVSKMTIRLVEQAQLLRREKEMLADSLADISHQIRTPLTALNLLVVSLRSPGLTPAEHREKLLEMSQLLARIEWQISVLLKIAKLDARTVIFEKREVPLRQLIQKAADPLQISMELRGQELVLKQVSGAFAGDLNWTAEAIGNIMKNCSECMGEGGILTVEAFENTLYSQIRISDTGPGISKEDLPHLFERFYKGEHSGAQSVGIGLALARMIITGQNGTIKADNGNQGGAVFTIRFYKQVI